jgi:hypothetical protein
MEASGLGYIKADHRSVRVGQRVEPFIQNLICLFTPPLLAQKWEFRFYRKVSDQFPSWQTGDVLRLLTLPIVPEQLGSYAVESNQTFQGMRFREWVRVSTTPPPLNCLNRSSPLSL